MTTKILVIAANPQGKTQLRVYPEIREIEDAIERGKQREQFSLRPKVAVRIEDLQKSMRGETARIVHFCGHGTGKQGLVLETTAGQQQLLDTQALAELFKLFATQVECVVLNACYSEVQAQVINQHINYVIGTKKEIRDDAAIAFSQGFYEAIADGETIERAFEFGKNRIQLEIYGGRNLDRKLVPVITETGEVREIPEHEVLKLLIKDPLNEIVEVTEENPKAIDGEEAYLDRNITINKHSGSGDNVTGNKNITNTYNQTGNFGIGHMSGGEIKGNAKIAGVINESSAKNLEEIAQEIEKLIDYLAKNPPINEAVSAINTAKKRQPKIDNAEIVTEAIQAQPTLRKRIEATEQTGYIETLKLLLPTVGKAIEDFKVAK